MFKKTNTTQQYKAALNDLKKVNDDLFYSELKEMMVRQQAQINGQLSENKQLNQQVSSDMNRLKGTFFNEINELSVRAEGIVQAQLQQFNDDFHSAQERLSSAYTSFKTISENYKKDMEEAQKSWDKSLSTLYKDLKGMSSANKKTLADNFDSLKKSLTEMQITAINSLTEAQAEITKENMNQFIQINNQSIKQAELVQSILNLLQQHQQLNEETRNNLSAKHSEELAALKSELRLQKKQQIKLGILMGTVQVLLSIGILATVIF